MKTKSLSVGAFEAKNRFSELLDRITVNFTPAGGVAISQDAHIIGIELLAAAQGVEFLRPLKSSDALEKAHALVRRDCRAMPTDHYLAPDIERAFALVEGGELAALASEVGSLHVLS